LNNSKLGDLIAKEQWTTYNSDQREWLIFNHLQKCDTRLKNLEKRKKIDTGITFVGGILGGMTAFIASRIKFGG